MFRRIFFAVIYCTSIALAAAAPWDKPSEQWTQSDIFRILRDSPWSPGKFSIEADYRQGRTDPQTRVTTNSPSNVQGAVVRSVILSRGHPLPAVTVLWWSSRTMRLAQNKRLESRAGSDLGKSKIDTGEAFDYILAVLGDEPLRILQDANGDLRDSVFLELENGGTLDFTSVKFVDDVDAEIMRTEFHFPRALNGEPAIDPDSERVIFHCRASAKKETPDRKSLSFRVEFSPRAMKVRGQPDL
jgi:hypothetical protein